MTAVYILNRSPTKILDWMNPYEAWHGCKTTAGHLHVFGYLVYVKERKTLATLMTGAPQGCSSATLRGWRPTTSLTLWHSVCTKHSMCVRWRARLVVAQHGGWYFDFDIHRPRHQLRPLRGDYGSGQLFFAKSTLPNNHVFGELLIGYAKSSTNFDECTDCC